MSRAKFRLSLAFLCLLSTAVYAQQGRGTILGTVTDSSAALVGGAKVTVTNIDTNITDVFTTNSSGFYTSTALNPGHYKVTATLIRF